MTDDKTDRIPEHGSTAQFEEDEARRERVEQMINDNQEAELSQDDYQFALQHGLIEG
ncbi:hypothetical protein [Deinococcus peraridilitoris]|uniref:Uncharacterized protein n=1 Tax=Deinococcus peraridilitoris (strain DSM 19664 / LMG 22246 / CIP 109416 / KR-200) TaxID=937777 RepID=L0A011_DEIPD|nr:hypothetical protein [Deinococcus peraridilitoris]AFZ67218.1 hypothetical protein Deipe_1692 [Deinococcus peraridilitoris DSM 19664]